MPPFAPTRSPLGVWNRSPLGVRDLVAPIGIDSRDFVELIITDNAGTLSGVLRLHGDVDNAPAGQFNKVRAISMFLDSTRASEGEVQINSGATFPSRSFDASLTNTVCNGATNIDTPLGVTDFTFTGGTATPPSGIADIERIRVKRAGIFEGEHWGDLVECTVNGNDHHFFDHTKLLQGTTKLNSINTTGVGQLFLCGGGFIWVGGGPNGGDANDSFVIWQNQAPGDFDGVLMAGPWNQWAIPANAIDFTGQEVPTSTTC